MKSSMKTYPIHFHVPRLGISNLGNNPIVICYHCVTSYVGVRQRNYYLRY